MSNPLPILDRPLDNTALADFMTCPRKYYYGMVLHRRLALGVGRSPALIYGTAWHRAMELHYKTNGQRDMVVLGIYQAWEDHGKQDDHRTVERCIIEYDNYVERWGLPSEESSKTLGYPTNPLVEVSVNAEWEGCLYPYAGKIDRIFEENGQLYVEDHKTTSQMGDYYFHQFALSNQMMGYAWLGKQITGRDIAGVRINAHAIYKRESKFARHVLSFSARRLQEWADNYNRWVERVRAAYQTNDFPGNYNACSGKYGMCQFASVCSMPPQLRQNVLEEEYVEKVWNPLEVKEDGEP